MSLRNNNSIKCRVRSTVFPSLPITKLRYQQGKTIPYNSEYSFRLHDAIIGAFVLYIVSSLPTSCAAIHYIFVELQGLHLEFNDK